MCSAAIVLIFTRSQDVHTAGMAQANKTNKQGIQHHMLSCSVLSQGADWGKINRCSGVHWALGGERVALCTPLFCIFLSVLLLLLFASFAVLLNCPYPDPQLPPLLQIPLPTPAGGSATEQPRDSVLLAGAKPRHLMMPLSSKLNIIHLSRALTF